MHRTFVEAAVDACIEVRSLVQNADSAAYAPLSRGAGGDLSCGFDLFAEACFVEHLSEFGTIYSEESGMMGDRSEHTIVLDPVDGSDNFKSGVPYYGASIALQHREETVAAVVCNFANGDCFVRFGEQHYLTSLDAPQKRTPVRGNPHASVGLFEKAYFHPEHVARLYEAGLKFRAPGAVALSLAYAHYVKYVLFFGTMRPYDFEAGLFLCQDLFVYGDDEKLIVAKERAVFEHLCTIFDLPQES